MLSQGLIEQFNREARSTAILDVIDVIDYDAYANSERIENW